MTKNKSNAKTASSMGKKPVKSFEKKISKEIRASIRKDLARGLPTSRRLRGRGDYTYSAPGPFGLAGRVAGASLGGTAATALLGPEMAPLGAFLGEKAGGLAHYVGRIFGSGDYELSSLPADNSFLQDTPDGFGTSDGFRIRNIEAVNALAGDESEFILHDSYSLNPCNSTLCPWLSSQAANYQEYRWNGIVFIYVTEMSDAVVTGTGSLGYIGMSVNYDATSPPPSNKREALNSFWSIMTKPSKNYVSFLECSPAENPSRVLYTWEGVDSPPATASQLYNLGTAYCWGGGQPSGTTEIGQLFVCYDITFLKPRLPRALATPAHSYYASFSAVSSATDVPTAYHFGSSAPTHVGGLLPVELSTTTLQVPRRAVDTAYMILRAAGRSDSAFDGPWSGGAELGSSKAPLYPEFGINTADWGVPQTVAGAPANLGAPSATSNLGTWLQIVHIPASGSTSPFVILNMDDVEAIPDSHQVSLYVQEIPNFVPVGTLSALTLGEEPAFKEDYVVYPLMTAPGPSSARATGPLPQKRH